MNIRPLGQSGMEASVIGLGTWAIGGWPWGGTDESESIRAIEAAMDAGITLIDTAPAYGLGLAEELVGKAIANRRHEVVLATKCGLIWDTTKGTYGFTEHDKPVHRYLGPESIENEIEQSLRRLGTDCIDLYQTHWPDTTTSVEETMSTLLDLKRKGKIKAIGVSNISVDLLKRYQLLGPVDSAQEKYSMIDREIEMELLPYCRDHNIALLAYSPLSRGLLTGKIGPERTFAEGDFRTDDPKFSAENRRTITDMFEECQPVADRHGLTYAQLAIAWTIAQPGITHALCGARNPAQSLENAKAGTITLTAEDLTVINKAIVNYSMISQA